MLITNDDGIDSPGQWVDKCRPPAIINLNVPDAPLEEIRGLCEAPLAAVGAVQTSVTDVTDGYVQLTYGEITAEPEQGTDAHALAEGWAVLTAIQSIVAPTREAVPGLDNIEMPTGHLRGRPATWLNPAKPSDDGPAGFSRGT